MKPFKKHKVKREMPESSSSRFRDTEEHDLAFYIHDRVQLMHQVFSVIKPKELKSLAPDCVRHISIDDLQELCTEELLGISSKRLCAIMDGAEPPTDTESSGSSPEHMETISLDSISSDDEILSQPSTKGKKHKHRKRNKSKSKHKHRESKRTEDRSSEEQSRASRAGLTVLELLELQARARAIRAQLQQDNARKSNELVEVTTARASSGDDEVEIKEEAPEVVEISSEDEKPNVQELEDKQSTTTKTTETVDNQKVVTKRVNDLVITVPQTKQPRKIKLNRNNVTVKSNLSIPAVTLNNSGKNTVAPISTPSTPKDTPNVTDKPKNLVQPKEDKKEKLKKKQKKKQKKADSDHDEITLQLSDTEKMDLLEDMDRTNYDIVTSSSEDSETSSESDADEGSNKFTHNNEEQNISQDKDVSDSVKEPNSLGKAIDRIEQIDLLVDNSKPIQQSMSPTGNKNDHNTNQIEIQSASATCNGETDKKEDTRQHQSNSVDGDTASVTNEDITNNSNNEDDSMKSGTETESITREIGLQPVLCSSNNSEVAAVANANLEGFATTETQEIEEGEIANEGKDLSEGELSEHEDSEVPSDPKPEIVCISDEENKTIKRKKNKKKDKKTKKEKKKKSDFRDGADQNFYKDTKDIEAKNKQIHSDVDKEIHCIDDDDCSVQTSDKTTAKDLLATDKNNSCKVKIIDSVILKHPSENKTSTKIPSLVDSSVVTDDNTEKDVVSINDNDDDEIFELSDDSSCFEVEGVTVLSKEPTTEEIEALSAKIDVTIDCEVTDKDKEEYDKQQEETEPSWKERYLGSKKVKQVLNTASILNALRKNNKKIKKKLAEEKQLKTIRTAENEKKMEEDIAEVEKDPAEGSIEQFNTLQGSTKYVDPVTLETDKQKGGVSKEMEKDAKQLLKMYKKLLKYNDMNRQKNPKKKKKHKKSKDKEKDNDKRCNIETV